MSSAELSSLIHELYATVTGPSKLTDFLERCCTFIGARLGSIVVWEMRTNTVRYVDACLLPRDAHEQYQRQYATDPIKQALTLHPPRRFYLRHELVSDEEVRAHPYFTEWYKLLGYDDVCSAAIPLNEHYRCHLGFTRNIGDPPFTRQETDFLDLLLPHIERSLVLFNMLDRLTLMSDLAQEHLAQTGAGFIVLSEEGRVTYMNRIARAMLASGPVIHEQEGLIRIDDPQAQRRFSTMVRECIAVSKRPNMMTGAPSRYRGRTARHLASWCSRIERMQPTCAPRPMTAAAPPSRCSIRLAPDSTLRRYCVSCTACPHRKSRFAGASPMARRSKKSPPR